MLSSPRERPFCRRQGLPTKKYPDRTSFLRCSLGQQTDRDLGLGIWDLILSELIVWLVLGQFLLQHSYSSPYSPSSSPIPPSPAQINRLSADAPHSQASCLYRLRLPPLTLVSSSAQAIQSLSISQHLQ